MTEYEIAREERLARNWAGSGVALPPDARRRDARARGRGRRRPERRKGVASSPTTRAARDRSGSAPDPPTRRSNRAEARRVKSWAEAGDDDPNIVDDDDDDDFFSSDEDDAGSSGEDDGAPGDIAEARAADEDDSSVEILELDEEEREDDDGIRDAAKAPVASRAEASKTRRRVSPRETTAVRRSPKPKPKPKSKSARARRRARAVGSGVADAFVAMAGALVRRGAPTSRGAMRLEDARLARTNFARRRTRTGSEMDGRRVASMLSPELLVADGDGGGSSGAEFARLGLADLERVVELRHARASGDVRARNERYSCRVRRRARREDPVSSTMVVELVRSSTSARAASNG